MATASGRVPHDNFAEGFRVGFQTVQGVNYTVPIVPIEPVMHVAMTPFLMGVRAGIKAAKAELIKHTNAGVLLI